MYLVAFFTSQAVSIYNCIIIMSLILTVALVVVAILMWCDPLHTHAHTHTNRILTAQLSKGYAFHSIIWL